MRVIRAMNSKYYFELSEKLEGVKDILKDCENIVSDHSERGDITQTLKIKEVRERVEIWLSVLIENY